MCLVLYKRHHPLQKRNIMLPAAATRPTARETGDGQKTDEAGNRALGRGPREPRTDHEQPAERRKHVWWARTILKLVSGCGLVETMRRTGMSKPTVSRWRDASSPRVSTGHPALADARVSSCQCLRISQRIAPDGSGPLFGVQSPVERSGAWHEGQYKVPDLVRNRLVPALRERDREWSSVWSLRRELVVVSARRTGWRLLFPFRQEVQPECLAVLSQVELNSLEGRGYRAGDRLKPP